jgi:hypothetical protein
VRFIGSRILTDTIGSIRFAVTVIVVAIVADLQRSGIDLRIVVIAVDGTTTTTIRTESVAILITTTSHTTHRIPIGGIDGAVTVVIYSITTDLIGTRVDRIIVIVTVERAA